MKKKIMLVFGTRPEAIKMAPIINCLKLYPDKFDLKVCVTSQHKQMLNQVLKNFSIKPDFDLNIMKRKQNLLDLTKLILTKMKNILLQNKPDIILVHGDTTTTFAVSLASFYASIPVGHIEGGLRTYNLKAPFPEEFNRQIVSKVATWHFAPTKLCKKNLLSEGFDKSSIFVVGNTVIDSLFLTLKKIGQNKLLKKKLEKFLNEKLFFEWKSEKFILVTAHRRESFGDGLTNICYAIEKLALKYRNIHFIFPLHMNPIVSNQFKKNLTYLNNVHLTDHLDYKTFIYLLKYSYLVLTDSGGIQEEAPSLKKPVLVMRQVTERIEAINAGTAKLIGTKVHSIVRNVSSLIDNDELYKKMSKAKNPYGDGLSAKRIVKILKKIS